MVIQTITKRPSIILEDIRKELKDIKDQLKRFVLLIPEENIKEYKNSTQIKKAYLKARKSR